MAMMMFKAKSNILPRSVQDLFIIQVEAKKGYTLKNSNFILPRFNSVQIWETFPEISGPSFVVQAN